MPANPPVPRRTRTLAGFARWALALMLALWLLAAALWGLLHGWIVPRIDQWRAPVQTWAAQRLGVPVHIAAIAARAVPGGLRIELADVQLPQLRPVARPVSAPAPEGADRLAADALQLPRVVVTLSLRALLRLGVEQVYVEGAQLHLQRSRDGAVHLAAAAPGAGGASVLDWALAQTELVLRGGTLVWHNAGVPAPPLRLHDVDLVLRNSAWRGQRQHSLRLDASPPPGWGARFTVMGQFRAHPATHASGWQHLNGQAYAEFAHVDFSRLTPALLPWLDAYHSAAPLPQGPGALRAWVDVRRGRPVAAVADVALARVQWPRRGQLAPWQMHNITGRMRVRQQSGPHAWHLAVQELAFTTDDGLHWPRSNWHARWQPARTAAGGGHLPAQGRLQTDRADLAVLAQLAQRLSLPAPWQTRLGAVQLAGQLHGVQVDWRGPWQQWQHYQARGAVRGLSLHHSGMGGVQALDAQFSLHPGGGQAQLSMGRAARLSLPSVFAEPDIAVQQLSATAHWRVAGEALDVRIPDLRFANADAAGQARVHWRSGAAGAPRLPGVLDLQGRLHRADATRVHRYLPLSIAPEARDYVRQAIRAGRSGDVRFTVRGPLAHLPFADPAHPGTFRIAAQVQGVHYDYAPAALLPPGQSTWPALHALAGELVFDKAALRVRAAHAQRLGAYALPLPAIEADIADLSAPMVQVRAQAQGALADMLALVKASPLSEMTGQALQHSQGSGPAQLAVQLHLPIDALERSRVQGSVTLVGNTLQWHPDSPRLHALRGVVQFSETGFALKDIQAHALGGPLQAEGGMANDDALHLRIHGTASADGLRAEAEAAPGREAAALLHHAQGQTPYRLLLGRHGGQWHIDLHSDLQGMALHLPAPLGKTADAAVPLHFARHIAAAPTAAPPGADAPLLHERISAQWGASEASGGALVYERSLHAASGQVARVLRGSIRLGPRGQGDAALPAHGVQAHITLPQLDLDGWLAWLARADAAPPFGDDGAAALSPYAPYLPAQWTLRVAQLRAGGRPWHDAAANWARQGAHWQGRLSARELDGHLAYHPGDAGEPAGRIVARLAHLNLPARLPGIQAAAPPPDTAAQPPRTFPALHVTVQDLQLAGQPLGQLHVQAHNHSADRHWHLERFDVHTPEAQWRASGHWNPRAQHSQLQFHLQLHDAGQLLTRWGLAGVFAQGHGSVQGAAQWHGTPLAPDWRSLSGNIRLDVQNGQFLKAEPGLAKLLGVLSLQSLPRRLALDFRDVFSNGFAFDFLRGDAHIRHGTAHTRNLHMQGVNAAVRLHGSADLAHATQDVHVSVIPEINAMTASLAATAVNPAVGLGSLLAQALLRNPLSAATTRQFHVHGGWSDPQVTQLPRRHVRNTTPTAAQ